MGYRDEANSLPPPGIVNTNSVWMSAMGWVTAMVNNALNHRPPLKSGVHRQVLLASCGWFLGYHLSKYANYTYAKRDQNIFHYVKIHPEEFNQKDKKTFAEIVEPYHPIR